MDAPKILAVMACKTGEVMVEYPQFQNLRSSDA